jgi:hypothetical protein
VGRGRVIFFERSMSYWHSFSAALAKPSSPSTNVSTSFGTCKNMMIMYLLCVVVQLILQYIAVDLEYK